MSNIHNDEIMERLYDEAYAELEKKGCTTHFWLN